MRSSAVPRSLWSHPGVGVGGQVRDEPWHLQQPERKSRRVILRPSGRLPSRHIEYAYLVDGGGHNQALAV